jgi:hypothetical protein
VTVTTANWHTMEGEMFAGWEELQRVARSGRVGRPVFVRCVIACPMTGGDAAPAVPPVLYHAAAAIEGAVALIGDRPRTLFARGEPASGDLHVLLDFETFATAMIAVAPGEPAWDAMLLGNHGAAYLEGDARRQTPDASQGGGSLASGVWRLASLIERALAEGRPVPTGEADDE